MILLPHLYVNFFGKKIHSFHFFGILGFVLGSLLGAIISYSIGLQVLVILIMSLTSAATFFLLAFGAKTITGKEVIVYYHHEIAILIACSCVLRIFEWHVLQYLDIIIVGIATFLAFGRIGCLSVGCCHGKPAKKGIIYGHDHVKSGFTSYYEGVPLLPVQLIESVFVFLVVIVGIFLLLWHSPPGTVLIHYAVVYGAFRFIIEFFRGDAERPYFKGLSEAQWTTLLLMVISLIFAFNGLIPYYSWHIIITLLIFIFSIIIVFQKDISIQISNPRHIRQIAMALNRPQNNEFSLIMDKNVEKSINIFQTDLGLSLSHGQIEEGGKRVMHYTVSIRKKNLLTYPIVTKLAVLIQQLEKHSCSFEITEKQNSVFHIVFKE